MLWFILAIVQVDDDGQTNGQEKGRQKQQQQQQPSSFCDIDLLQSHRLGHHDCVAASSPVPTPINKNNDSSIMMVAQQKQQEEQEQEEQSVNDK